MLLADALAQPEARPDHLSISFNVRLEVSISTFPRVADSSLLAFMSSGLSAVRLTKGGKALDAEDRLLAIRRLPNLYEAKLLIF